MPISIACFSNAGEKLAEKIAAHISPGDNVRVARCGAGMTVREWAAANFPCCDALIIVGAAGIAVRAIAPHVAGKTSDPAVVVVDDAGRYAVSLLSGHIGGANALAVRIAEMLGAQPVITTATDARGLFAVDTWAAERGMKMKNTGAIKKISGTLLAGREVLVYSKFAITGAMPARIAATNDPDKADFVISVREETTDALVCIPPIITAGIGCRKNVSAAILGAMLDDICGNAGICPEAVGAIASIDIKRCEPGLVELSQRRGLPFVVFSARELAAVPGDFSGSERVGQATGVDNVCERAAVAAGGGALLVKKQTGNGAAMALALAPFTVDFGSVNG